MLLVMQSSKILLSYSDNYIISVLCIMIMLV